MPENKVRQLEQVFIVATFTTFMGQIYLTPFGSEFRLTLAVVVLNVLMLTFKEIRPMLTINLVGFLTFSIRVGLYALTMHTTFFDAIKMFYPVPFFYIFYSLFFVLLDLRGSLKHPIQLFLSLWICDSIPNIIEVIIRREWLYSQFDQVVLTLIMIGLFRSIITTLLIYISNSYYEHVKRRQAVEQFRERLLLNANLKTELFFLRKSKQDIENAMQKSFGIYEQLIESDQRDAILEVTKDIHEIKKDYTRVIAGMEKTLDVASDSQFGISEIIDIALAAHEGLAISEGKKIKFYKNVKFKGQTTRYYELLSVLNNLLVNAVEAIQYEGEIRIVALANAEALMFIVSDTGQGIKPDDLDFIFEPGYSTKFDRDSGMMSSGIGLTHVRNLVESLFEGKIVIESTSSKGTTFHITVPLKNVLSE